MYDRDALRRRNASKTHKLHNLGSDINRRLQYWMDPAVVVVYIKSRVYIIMHMATVIQAWQLAWPRYATPIKLRWQLNSNRKHCSSKGWRETQMHHRTLLTGRKHPNAARRIEFEAEKASLPVGGPSSANPRLSMSATEAPVSLTPRGQPTTSCYIIRRSPTADGPVLEGALQLKLPHSSTDL